MLSMGVIVLLLHTNRIIILVVSIGISSVYSNITSICIMNKILIVLVTLGRHALLPQPGDLPRSDTAE